MERIIYKQSTVKKETNNNYKIYHFSVKDMVEIALFTAIAIILDRFVRIPISPTGGSANISAVPLMIICLRHGYYKGFIASGIIYGVATSTLDAYGFEYFLFDYLLAFGSVSVMGLFAKPILESYKNKKALSFALVIISSALWLILRVVFASIDSVIYYGYTFMAGVVYNLSYSGISALADCILVCILLPALISITKRFKTSFLK